MRLDMEAADLKMRTKGLPPALSANQYIGFSEDGRAFVMKWSKEFGVWGAVGWDLPDPNYGDNRPVVIACREDMANFIVSHVLVEMPYAMTQPNLEVEIRRLIDDWQRANPEKVMSDYPNLAKFFVEQVMLNTNGAANPIEVQRLVAQMLPPDDL